MDLRPKMRKTSVGLEGGWGERSMYGHVRMRDVRGLHETVHDRSSKPSRTHSRSKCDEDVNLLI